MNFADVKALTIPEGSATKITASGGTVLWQAVTNFTITKYLSDVTSNNSATTITSGSSYTATLTAASSMYLYNGNVTVTMGGRDVTSSAVVFSADFKTATISISKVTGKIVISAEATYQNLLKESTDEDGNIFNDCGYIDGEEYDGSWYYATGFIPCTKSTKLYFEYMEVVEGDKLVFYNSSKTQLATLTVNFDDSYNRFESDGDGYLYSFKNGSIPVFDGGTNASAANNMKYVRVFCQYIDEYSIISGD